MRLRNNTISVSGPSYYKIIASKRQSQVVARSLLLAPARAARRARKPATSRDRRHGIRLGWEYLCQRPAAALKLIEIHEQIDHEYPNEIDLTEIFDFPTIAELARHLEGKLARGRAAQLAPSGPGVL